MKQKREKRPVPGKPQRITKAVTHIRLLMEEVKRVPVVHPPAQSAVSSTGVGEGEKRDE